MRKDLSGADGRRVIADRIASLHERLQLLLANNAPAEAWGVATKEFLEIAEALGLTGASQAEDGRPPALRRIRPLLRDFAAVSFVLPPPVIRLIDEMHSR